jgi:hypothetical protein
MSDNPFQFNKNFTVSVIAVMEVRTGTYSRNKPEDNVTVIHKSNLFQDIAINNSFSLPLVITSIVND